MMLGPVIINGTWPPLPGLETDVEQAAKAADVSLTDDEVVSLGSAGAYRTERCDMQQGQLARLARELPLTTLNLDFVFTNELDQSDLTRLADELLAGIDALDPALTD